jgi:hypothetical protein
VLLNLGRLKGFFLRHGGSIEAPCKMDLLGRAESGFRG